MRIYRPENAGLLRESIKELLDFRGVHGCLARIRRVLRTPAHSDGHFRLRRPVELLDKLLVRHIAEAHGLPVERLQFFFLLMIVYLLFRFLLVLLILTLLCFFAHASFFGLSLHNPLKCPWPVPVLKLVGSCGD